jgi:hypothetical protein
MSRPFILLGDKTDHGGTVIEGAPSTDTAGKRIARLGDEVTCPQRGHGGSPSSPAATPPASSTANPPSGTSTRPPAARRCCPASR